MTQVPTLPPEPAVAPTYVARRRPLHRIASWTVLGTLVYTGSQAAILMVLAKMGSKEVMGDFALAMAVADPITVIGRLGMRPLVATETGRELRFSDYLAVQMMTIPFCLAALIAIGIFGPFRAHMAWTILTIGCASLVESTGTVFYGLMDRHERQRQIAQLMAVKGVGGLIAVAVAFWLTGSTAWSGAALAGWWFVVLLFGDVPIGSHLNRLEGGGPLLHIPTRTALRRIVGMCLTVSLTAGLREFFTSLPAYLLRAVGGRAAVGFYAAASTMAKMGRIIFRGFNQAASPRLAHYFHFNHPAYLRLSLKLLLVCAGLGGSLVLVAVLLGDKVLALAYTSEFAAYQSTFIWLAIEVTFALAALSLRQSMVAARTLMVAQIPQVLLTGAVLAVACWVLIPRFGVDGAAMACVAASVFEVITGGLLFWARQPNSRLVAWCRRLAH